MADDRGPVHHPRLVRLLLVSVALLGLLAMHGVSTHGTTHDSGLGAHAVGSQMSASMDASPSSPNDVDGQSMPHNGGAGLVGLCLAVLGAALIGLLWPGRSGRWQGMRLRVRERWVDVSATTSRDRDPPCLHTLSIQRC